MIEAISLEAVHTGGFIKNSKSSIAFINYIKKADTSNLYCPTFGVQYKKVTVFFECKNQKKKGGKPKCK